MTSRSGLLTKNLITILEGAESHYRKDKILSADDLYRSLKEKAGTTDLAPYFASSSHQKSAQGNFLFFFKDEHSGKYEPGLQTPQRTASIEETATTAPMPDDQSHGEETLNMQIIPHNNDTISLPPAFEKDWYRVVTASSTQIYEWFVKKYDSEPSVTNEVSMVKKLLKELEDIDYNENLRQKKEKTITADWLKTQEENTSEAYAKFLELYEFELFDHQFVADAKEKYKEKYQTEKDKGVNLTISKEMILKEWKATKLLSTIEAYYGFIQRYKIDPRVKNEIEIAQKEYDWKMVQQKKTKKAYEDFIRTYKGKSIAAVEVAIAETRLTSAIMSDNQETIEAGQSSMNADWASAQKINTKEAYARFIKKYEHDPLALKLTIAAKKRLDELNSN